MAGKSEGWGGIAGGGGGGCGRRVVVFGRGKLVRSGGRAGNLAAQVAAGDVTAVREHVPPTLQGSTP